MPPRPNSARGFHATGIADITRRAGVAPEAFQDCVAENQLICRIIDEAEVVHPESHRAHDETTAARIARRLRGRGAASFATLWETSKPGRSPA